MLDRTLKKDRWDANLYDGSHSFVSKFGEDLVELLAPFRGERILDLGCGTGDLANKLHEMGVHVIGIDKSENMVRNAKEKYPHITFTVQDAEKLTLDREFEAVFSNAALHWIKQPEHALSGIYNALKQGGRFVAEFGGKGNVQTISDEIEIQLTKSGLHDKPGQFPWYFPSIGEYSTLMEKAGFRVILAQHFNRPTQLEGDRGLRNWIEMFASSMFENVSGEIKELILTNVEENLKDVLFQDGGWIADYKRIRVMGIKE
ncbi:class I SAM-dependent methyltransferase [Peribacillus glennii]|uniref:class I SAM-dependent methyltransferase n=1 Tax=Peribacillus glennii TaxID=2303991 RepID=UPI001F2EE35E|nr:class I SAM-dependent methyltransferase [Peribacillus glennii]